MARAALALALQPSPDLAVPDAPVVQPVTIHDYAPRVTHGLPPGSILDTNSRSTRKYTAEGRVALIRNGPCYNCKTVLSTRWCRKLRGEEEHPDGRVWCVTCADSDYQMKRADEKNPGRTRNPKDLNGGPCYVCEKVKSSNWKDDQGMPLPKRKASREDVRGGVWCMSCWKRKSEAAGVEQRAGPDGDPGIEQHQDEQLGK